MSRMVGPYSDVATARVEGAYELCEGVDETGRAVQILTLGTTSSKDPARRGLLSDTVAWAHATTGPEDAPILTADLDAEQPYVVVLHDQNLRGADRIMDRLLAMGPATGPLPTGPAAAAQRAAARSQAAPQGSPTGAMPASPTGPMSAPPTTAPPMSPQVVIAPPKKRSQLKPILIGVTSVVVAIALVVGGWLLWSSLQGGEGDGAAPAADTASSEAADEVDQAPEEAAEDQEPQDQMPQRHDDAGSESVAGPTFTDSDDTEIQAFAGWPIAFLVPAGVHCEATESSAVCVAPDGESQVTVGWEVCQGKCSDADRTVLREDLPYQPLADFADGVAFSQRDQVYGYWRAALSVFSETADRVLHISATADVHTEQTAAAQKIVNDVLNQAQAITKE